jgi:hypothetical protein
MDVNANPRVRVTAVIGDTSQERAWKAGFEADKESDKAGKKRKPRTTRGFREAD